MKTDDVLVHWASAKASGAHCITHTLTFFVYLRLMKWSTQWKDSISFLAYNTHREKLTYMQPRRPRQRERAHTRDDTQNGTNAYPLLPCVETAGHKHE